MKYGKTVSLVLLLIFVFITTSFSLATESRESSKESPPPPWQKSVLAQDIVKISQLFLAGETAKTLKALDNFQQKYPGTPFASAGRMGLYVLKMVETRTLNYQKQYEKAYRENRKLRSLRRWQGTKEYPLYHFFYAGSFGVHGYYKVYLGEYFSGMRYLLRSLSFLEDLHYQNKEFADPLLGLGAFKYGKGTVAEKLGLSFLMGDNKAKGISDLEKAIAEGFLFAPLGNYILAYIYEREKEYKNAEEAILPLIKKYPKNCIFAQMYVDILVSSKQLEKASKLLHRLLTSNCQPPIIHYKLGFLQFFKEKNFSQAEKNLLQASQEKFFRVEPPPENILGQLYREQGKKEKAAKQWQIAIKKYKDKQSKEFLKQLKKEDK